MHAQYYPSDKPPENESGAPQSEREPRTEEFPRVQRHEKFIAAFFLSFWVLYFLVAYIWPMFQPEEAERARNNAFLSAYLVAMLVLNFIVFAASSPILNVGLFAMCLAWVLGAVGSIGRRMRRSSVSSSSSSDEANLDIEGARI